MHLTIECQILRAGDGLPNSHTAFSNRALLRWSHFVWTDTRSRNDCRTTCISIRIRRSTSSSVAVFILFPTNGKTRASVIFTSSCMKPEWIALHFPTPVSFSGRPNALECETCCGKNDEIFVRTPPCAWFQFLMDS